MGVTYTFGKRQQSIIASLKLSLSNYYFSKQRLRICLTISVLLDPIALGLSLIFCFFSFLVKLQSTFMTSVLYLTFLYKEKVAIFQEFIDSGELRHLFEDLSYSKIKNLFSYVNFLIMAIHPEPQLILISASFLPPVIFVIRIP